MSTAQFGTAGALSPVAGAHPLPLQHETPASASAAVPGIELIDVYTSFDSEWVLQGISFAAPKGAITVVIGPSGVGKTTSLRHITGLLTPSAGDVLVDGRSALALSRRGRLELNKRFGVLLQGSGLYGSALWEEITVQDNLLHQLHALRPASAETERAITRQRLEEIGLWSSAELYPKSLSAGMRRRLALARALVSDPEFAVLDSFELGADPVRLTELIKLVARSHERSGGTYLLATQSMRVARELADHLVVLWNGQVIEQGPAAQVLSSEQPEVHQLINGLTDGPMDMGGELRRAPARARVSNRDHVERDFELPVPLVAIAVLVIMSASAIYLGHNGTPEIIGVLVAWVLVIAGLVARRPGG